MRYSDYPISTEIKDNLDQLGYKRPTDIQYKAIKPILAGEDVLAIAQTGTGKTAAFVIPILNILQKRRRQTEGVRCLVMVPTRELATQIAEVFDKIGSGTRLNMLCVVGGVEQNPQIAKLQRGVDVLIATPGRMFDLIYQKHIRITATEILVLDEADQMLALGFIKDIQDVKKFLPKHHQTLFFSATINEDIKGIAYSLVKNAIRIQISPQDRISKNITHSVSFVEMDDKRFFLERLISENPDKKIIVFVRTKVRAERVASAMLRVGIKTETLHGDKEQTERQAALNNFKTGKCAVLVATDVSARGIDIPNVDFVLNYDLPEVSENYVHRVGRTGRGMQKGRAISFCSSEEKPILNEIEGFLTKPIQVLEIDKNDYQATIDFSKDEDNYDMKALMKEVEAYENRSKKKKKK